MLDAQVLKMDEEIGSEKLDSNSSDVDTVEESDSETVVDSVSSHGGDSQTADDDKAEKVVRAPKREGTKKKPVSGYTPQAPNSKANRKTKSQQVKDSKGTPKRESKPEKGPTKSTSKNSPDNNPKSMKKVHPKPQSDSSEGGDIQSLDREKVIDVIDHASNGTHSVRSDDDSVLNVVDDDDDQDKKAALEQKIQEMEVRIENLESELREVAALEIALYTVVPEHGSSAHKVHTPARRLSRLYIYACKHWTQDRRATVAKNTVSGLVLVSKSCGNDVSRLTFWLSNTIVLREIIYQAFGRSSQSSPIEKAFESHRGERKSDAKSSSLKWKISGRSRQLNKQGFLQFVEDWQETRTLTAALEKVESWIFSRIVESIWWQTLTPNMQSPTGGSTKNRIAEKLLGPSLGDQKQGDFSINLWRNAFNDALKRLCPVRAARHECGCLPILARKVMEQCVARLDVAMFNAILRESAFEIPTDPVSDPIVDPKVLPIPAGELSFGSGAQLKNSVGNWARWLSDFLGMDTDTSSDDETKNGGNDDKGKQRSEESKVFRLLNELSDLLMLPKDMLMDQTIRTEVCPSISLPLVKRILCNFTPDEFCPDPVPGAVLEIINAECIVDRRLAGEHSDTFPYAAASVVYTPPSSSDVSEKVLEADANPQLLRNASSVQRKGYTSDQELDELEHCLSSIVFINKTSTSEINGIGNGSDREEEEEEEEERGCVNARYDLLREVWHAP